ncbi:hypothetical protein Tco_1251396, partial [Tanacetum coccineum]
HQSSSEFPSLASLGHNDPGTPYTASGLIGLADSDPCCNKAGIFISQDKYVAEILKKFDLVNVKTAITPMETKVALTKDKEAVDVDVTPKTSHLNDVKRIFKYLKGKPNLGLWYPRESSFDLKAY